MACEEMNLELFSCKCLLCGVECYSVITADLRSQNFRLYGYACVDEIV